MLIIQQVKRPYALTVKGTRGPHLLGLQRVLFPKREDEKATWKGPGTQHLPTLPTSFPQQAHTPLLSTSEPQADGPAKLHNQVTENVSRGDFKELHWISFFKKNKNKKKQAIKKTGN